MIDFLTNIHVGGPLVIDLGLGDVIATCDTGLGPNGVTWVAN